MRFHDDYGVNRRVKGEPYLTFVHVGPTNQSRFVKRSPTSIDLYHDLYFVFVWARVAVDVTRIVNILGNVPSNARIITRDESSCLENALSDSEII